MYLLVLAYNEPVIHTLSLDGMIIYVGRENMSRSPANPKRKPKKTPRVNKQAVLHATQGTRVQSQRQSNNYISHTLQQSNTPVIKASLPPLSSANLKERKLDWKPALQQYITRYNQAETDQFAPRLNDLYSDEIHHDRVEVRLDRIRERDLLRGVHAEGSETKAEIVQVNELDREIVVNLRLHVKRRLQQDGQQYIEERYDHERVWLMYDQGKWLITKIEPIMLERKPRFGGAVMDWSSEHEAEEEPPVIAVPYLNTDVIPNFRRTMQGKRYRRDLVVAYADQWWNKGNPTYEEFDSNCTNYVSQCIFAGDVPMIYTSRRDSGWWYKGRQQGKEWWSYSWAVSKALASFLMKPRKQGLRAVEKEYADELELGDIIVYDWNGNTRYQHTTIVTAFDAKGQPLVNANTAAGRHRYWDYQDSYAWTPNTHYRFFHITDYV